MKRIELTPKYSVGQKVKLKKPDLYGQVYGEITEIEKVYQAVHEDGSFDMHGLATLESTIEAIAIPHKLEGDMLTVTYPSSGKSQVSKFHHFAYTVKTSAMLLLANERNFTIIQ